MAPKEIRILGWGRLKFCKSGEKKGCSENKVWEFALIKQRFLSKEATVKGLARGGLALWI